MAYQDILMIRQEPSVVCLTVNRAVNYAGVEVNGGSTGRHIHLMGRTDGYADLRMDGLR